MKRAYFVRHGETVANIEGRIQGLDDPLTPEGEIQATRVAARVTSLPIETCISSDALRARQTAGAIEAELKMSFTFSPLFREIKRPSSLIGLTRDSESYKAFAQGEQIHAHEDWHFEDEENYFDREQRAKEALAFLGTEESSDILVVTHGHFLRFLVSAMLMNGHMTPEVWSHMAGGLWTENTGITVCVRNEHRWRLLTWNDHAHFGDDVFQRIE